MESCVKLYIASFPFSNIFKNRAVIVGVEGEYADQSSATILDYLDALVYSANSYTK